MNVRTEFINPPIPIRDYDWSATFQSYEPGDFIGYGATVGIAVQNLYEQVLGELLDAASCAEKDLARIIKENPHNEAFYGDTHEALKLAIAKTTF